MSTEKEEAASGCTCTGCLGCLALVFVLWALVFGITVGGVHHAVTCSTERGVEVR